MGSSPLTRGAHVGMLDSDGALGLLPAYAGSTPGGAVATGGCGAHPRLRGEHPEPCPVLVICRGSSPLTRGAHGMPVDGPLATGLIPAYAGSTPGGAVATGGCGAHPRLRGEHQTSYSETVTLTGSSPLTRGAPVPVTRVPKLFRLIPAYAGSTRPHRSFRLPPWAHPRLRGEHRRWGRSASTATGSSPLTRGARVDSVGVYWLGGSSPLTRGAPLSFWAWAVWWRLIPAYAGSTLPLQRKRRRHGAHPRLRGEHPLAFMDGERVAGSSPLTRGALNVGTQEEPNWGLIPAYAGSTT